MEKGSGQSDGAAVEIDGGVCAHAANACRNVFNPSIPRQILNWSREMIGERGFGPPELWGAELIGSLQSREWCCNCLK